MSAAQWEQEVAVLRAEHRATVGGDILWQWSCSCGRSGMPTTRGRAAAGQDRHLTAERKKIRRRLDDASDDEWAWCTEDCPEDCMADHRGEE